MKQLREKKDFNVSTDLTFYVTQILDRRNIPFLWTPCCLCDEDQKEGTEKLSVAVSGAEFHRIIVRASVEKYCDQNDTDVMYVAKSETLDPKYLDFICAEHNRVNYEILDTTN